MRAHTLQEDPIRTDLLVFGAGEPVVDQLLAFAETHDVTAGRIGPGIGAFSEAVLAFFAPEEKRYEEIPVEEQTEVLNFSGNIARYDGEPRLHLHATLGRRDGECVGGHLRSAVASPTLEVFVTQYDRPLERVLDEDTGLPLLPR